MDEQELRARTRIIFDEVVTRIAWMVLPIMLIAFVFYMMDGYWFIAFLIVCAVLQAIVNNFFDLLGAALIIGAFFVAAYFAQRALNRLAHGERYRPAEPIDWNRWRGGGQ